MSKVTMTHTQLTEELKKQAEAILQELGIPMSHAICQRGRDVYRSGDLMLPIRPTSQFKKDLKRARKQGHDLDLLRRVLEQLANMEPLPASFRDHKLKGIWRDFRG